MRIVSYFKHNSEPAEGLIPKIKIRSIGGEIIVDGEPMIEIGDGFYTYEFEKYQEGIQYTVLTNGGSELSADERYSHGIIDAIDPIDAISFIKNIEGGRWKIQDNQMVFFKEDNKTEVAKFNLYNQAGQRTSDNVMERRRVFEPASGYQIIHRTNRFVLSNPLGIPNGTYRFDLKIDSVVNSLNIIYNGEALGTIVAFINNALLNKATCTFVDGDLKFTSISKGYNSSISIESSPFITALNAVEQLYIMSPVNGYGEEGPV